jgi:hypothetical protein
MVKECLAVTVSEVAQLGAERIADEFLILPQFLNAAL